MEKLIMCIEKIDPKWVVNLKEIKESLLLEKTRSELINKSKNADIVKSYNTTRYDRRTKQTIYNTDESFNNIDMNNLFKNNKLLFSIPVEGETNVYVVDVLFKDVCDAIYNEIKQNKFNCDYKCIYRALVKMVNNQNIYICCSCPDWHFRMSYYATKDNYNSGKKELIPSKITNPNNSKGAGCKHALSVLSNLSWVLNLASAINNYIVYMKDKRKNEYENLIYPKLYKKKYDENIDKEVV